MWSEEDHMEIWKAGEVVPAGVYVRIDDHSYRSVVLNQTDRLPASYDGRVAWYALSPVRGTESNTLHRRLGRQMFA
jgi:hypothetical protein